MMKKKRSECLLALLCHGADCNVMDSLGETVLHKAIKVIHHRIQLTLVVCVGGDTSFMVYLAEPEVAKTYLNSLWHLLVARSGALKTHR